MPDKCLDCPAPSADMDGFIVSGPGGAPRSEGSGVSSPEGPFVREAPQTGPFLLKGKVSSSSSLPDVPEPGWAYEAAEAGTYGGVQATVGDLVWCAGVNPVRWAVLQSDSDDSGRDLVSVSASFDCGGQTWYLSSCDVNSYPEEDTEYVDCAVAPASIDGNLSVDLSPTYVGGSISPYVFKRIFLLSNVPVYGGVCYRRAGGYDSYNIFISEGYEDIVPEDLVLFSLWARIDNYSMPAAGEEIELPVDLGDHNNTGIVSAAGIGASASAYNCAGRDRIVVHGTLDHLSASPLKFYATGPESGNVGRLRVEKNPAFDWSRYESGAKLTLASTSASGEEAVQEVDMSCLSGMYGRLDSLSASMDCASVSGQFSPYSPQSCRFYSYDYAGEDLVEKISMEYSLSGSTLSFDWFDDDAQHAVVVLDGVQVDVAIFTASVGSVYEGLAPGRAVRLELVSSTPAGAESTYVFSLSSAPASSVLSLTSTDASGAESTQAVDMSCLVPPVFDGSKDGLVPASGAVQNHLLAGNGTWMRPATDAEIDALFA